MLIGDERNSGVIVYNAISDDYTILSDRENYKAINVITFRHCIFKNTINYNVSEYISFDADHIALYRHNNGNGQMYRLQLNSSNIENSIKFPTGDAICLVLSNSKGM